MWDVLCTCPCYMYRAHAAYLMLEFTVVSIMQLRRPHGSWIAKWNTCGPWCRHRQSSHQQLNHSFNHQQLLLPSSLHQLTLSSNHLQLPHNLCTNKSLQPKWVKLLRYSVCVSMCVVCVQVWECACIVGVHACVYVCGVCTSVCIHVQCMSEWLDVWCFLIILDAFLLNLNSLPLLQEYVTICGHAISSQKLAQAKLQTDPSKAALKLLACLFSPEELVNGNPTGSTNSKDVHRQETIKKLDTARMQYLKGIPLFLLFSDQICSVSPFLQFTSSLSLYHVTIDPKCLYSYIYYTCSLVCVI